ncbi:hypothetical protein PEC301296_08520 [Pectobacterium carotovorum subsp. carotovorum]|nr:hypothetical protein GZ59_32120 [Pectobacterium atrosepticum]POW31590.1 hypothetical protein PB72LOC_01017 [Pectobacterium atrosepticum]GKV84540.1 hypothetical protein PEC301296_08520 [Pectobacterium carotovorum subsp. carotovorum]
MAWADWASERTSTLIRSGRSNNGQESEKNHQSGRMTSYLSTEKVLKNLGLMPIYLKE